MSPDSGMYLAAVALLRRGFAVFPLAPRGKAPLAESHGCSEATRELGKVRAWWSRVPDANPAVATGERWGNWVLDVDTYKGGGEDLAALEAQHGPLPATLTVATPRGGEHRYWQAAAGVRTRRGGNLPDGLDVRGWGGHVVGPGGIGANGQPYRITVDAPIAVAPIWLADLARGPAAAASVASGCDALAMARARPETAGQSRDDIRRMVAFAKRALARETHRRNELLNYWAFTLAGTGIGRAELAAELWEAVTGWVGLPPSDPFTRREFEKTFQSGYGAGSRRTLPKLAGTAGGRR